jgi:hypothetical protein
MAPSLRRKLLLLLLVPYAIIQVFAALDWVPKYGLDSLDAFIDLSTSDPLLVAAMTDYHVLELIIGVWMLADLPAPRWRPRTFIWLTAFIIYPGLGPILYFLWLNPGHRLLTGQPAPHSPVGPS